MPKAMPVKGKKNPSSALTRALRFEKHGKRFFTAAAAKAADPYAKQMFELLAILEDKHIQDIMAISRKIEENNGKFPAVSATPHESRMRMFKRETARIRKETVVSWDAASAMRRALGFEAEGREMYKRMAETASHPQERKFFKLLSAEEQSHFDIIYEYLDSFENVGLRMRED
ncbi:MAG: ferritin family protein [Deltaproteobacteria bacterium]|nr:ferritin family protein [Deltaproteobacteria bacterium]